MFSGLTTRRTTMTTWPRLGAVALLLAVVWCGGPVRAGAANPPTLPSAGYVPAPQPVDTGRYLIGAVMCPLWQGGRRWGDLVAYPERKPALGWYDEGDPEVTDWEISWALDHGISFFMVCWYRAKDNFAEPAVRPALGHWLHDGLPRSRYGDRFKFAIMWENANKQYANPTSEADLLTKLVPFWIENYFRRANYLVIDGRPVFSIYSPEKFVRELGGEALAAAAIEAMRAACVRAGFKGLHLLGQYCWGEPKKLQELAGEVRRIGMDASWAYHWPTFTGAFRNNLRPSGSEAIAAQERLWQTQPPATCTHALDGLGFTSVALVVFQSAVAAHTGGIRHALPSGQDAAGSASGGRTRIPPRAAGQLERVRRRALPFSDA